MATTTAMVGDDNYSTFETAVQHATRRVPVAHPGQRIRDVREALLTRRYDSASHIVVCEDGRSRGVVTIEDVLGASADATV
jgi:CBS domain-containing protein